MNRSILLLVIITIVVTYFAIAGIPAMVENYRTFDVGS